MVSLSNHRTMILNQLNKGLLLIAHGSPKKDANEEFVSLANHVQSRAPDFVVQHAFLDCSQPDISSGIDLLVDKQVSEIVVLPYFLVAGKHAAHDIAKIVEEKRKEHRGVAIILKSPVGSSPEMINLILKMFG